MDNLLKIKILLQDRASNYTDALLELLVEETKQEIKEYCNREELDDVLNSLVQRIVIIKLNRMNTEGVAGQSFSGVSETYVNGYPEDIMCVLRKKRKLKIL